VEYRKSRKEKSLFSREGYLLVEFLLYGSKG